jgi:Fe-S cluster assembly protein SufD
MHTLSLHDALPIFAKPVEVLFFTRGGAASYPRVLYWLGENSKMTVVEHHAGQGQYLANSHIDAVQERDSRLKLYRTVDETAEASHVSLTGLHMLKGAQFEGFSGAFGGRLCRQEFQMKLLERGIYSSISGIYLKEGQQSQDFTIVADHFEEDGTSKQHFKGVIDDQARAVFQGKIHVHRSAQKTDGYQSHHALLLSDQAEASAKPELEIYADDVKCSHGATSGQLNEEALFYLRSRGIPAQQAKALLIESFLNEGIDKIDHPEVRGLLQARVSAWLARRA